MFRKTIASTLAALAIGAFGALSVSNVYAAVDANRASQAELETVKGIGPGLAAKLLKARESGAFKSWADLIERVPGVGPGNAAKFADNGLTVGTTAFDRASLAETAPRGRKAAAARTKADNGAGNAAKNAADKDAPAATRRAAGAKKGPGADELAPAARTPKAKPQA